MVEKVEFTNLCMISDGNKVVVIDRKKKDWPGVTFPGGHVELGESFSDAVIREAKEETGLDITDLTFYKDRLNYAESKIGLKMNADM